MKKGKKSKQRKTCLTDNGVSIISLHSHDAQLLLAGGCLVLESPLQRAPNAQYRAAQNVNGTLAATNVTISTGNTTPTTPRAG